MMKSAKRFFKRNTRNLLFKVMAGLGKSFYRLYENRNHDIYSNGESYLLRQIGKLKPQLIFDVGGNVGEYAELTAKHCPTAKIFSFEPVSATYQLLKEVAGRIKNIEPVMSGFYKEKRVLEISTYPEHQLSTLYHDPADTRETMKESIDLIKGDDFILERRINHIEFMKVDVEGAEMDVFIGLEESIRQKMIRVIQFEYGNVNINTKVLLIYFHKFFEKHGYIVGKLYPKGVEFRRYEVKHEDFIGPNFVAIPKDDLEIKDLLTY